MDYPDEKTVIGWDEHDTHADDAAVADREERLVYGGEPDPPEADWQYVYDRGVPRTVLDGDFYQQGVFGPVLDFAVKSGMVGRLQEMDWTVEKALRMTLARVGLLAPPPMPKDGSCASMWPDEDGFWFQCTRDRHDDVGGDHWNTHRRWNDDDANVETAFYSSEPPF